MEIIYATTVVFLACWMYRLQSLFKSQLLSDKNDFLERIIDLETSISKKFKSLELEKEKELAQGQKEFKKKIEKQYELLFQQAQKEFDEKLKQSYKIACDQIKFDEIEYKKTITKKRKDYTRKNGKNAKPQKIWRSIYDEFITGDQV
jgi:hypothetical protein